MHYIKFMEVERWGGVGGHLFDPHRYGLNLQRRNFTTHNMQTRNWIKSDNRILEVDFMYQFFDQIEQDFRLLHMPFNAFMKDGRIYNCHLKK